MYGDNTIDLCGSGGSFGGSSLVPVHWVLFISYTSSDRG
jgi:hypothetical protein